MRLLWCIGISAFAAASWVWPWVPMVASGVALFGVAMFFLRLFLYPND